jgi:hypothetical protein
VLKHQGKAVKGDGTKEFTYLADLRGATFRLDKAAEAHLAALAAAGGLSRDPATTEPFSYSR